MVREVQSLCCLYQFKSVLQEKAQTMIMNDAITGFLQQNSIKVVDKPIKIGT
jgi:hypothetical protein